MRARHQAIDAMERAEADLKDAKAAEPRRLVDALVNGGDGAEDTLADAERAVQSANTEYERHKRLDDALTEQIAVAQREVAWARGPLNEQIKAIITSSPEVASLLAEREEARRRLNGIDKALQFLAVRADPRVSQSWTAEAPALFDVRASIDPEPLSRWQAALRALEQDADAALPDQK